jgi:hypothetical protein
MKIFPKVLFFGGASALLFVGVNVYQRMLAFQYQELSNPRPPTQGLTAIDVRLGMQVVVSLVLLAATVFVIVSKRYVAKDKHWAYSTLGLVVGFWLRVP